MITKKYYEIMRNESLPYCHVCDVVSDLVEGGSLLTCSDNLIDDCWSEDAVACP